MSEQIIYGLHAVSALLNNSKRKISYIYLTNQRQDERINALELLAIKRNINIERVDLNLLNKRFDNLSHQGVVAIATPLPNYTEHDLDFFLQENPLPLILILDGITDPHNLGACLRSADAAGVDIVIIPKDKNVSITPVVSKVACGAAESVPLMRVTNLARVMTNLKDRGIWIYGAAGEASGSIYQVDMKIPLALVMGAEGDGMRRLTREHCDGLFSLPMQGQVSSLNVSVATGICLYEALRQRIKQKN